jgi:serine/threonine-protein kinase
MPTEPDTNDAARWTRVADVFDAAVDLPPGERAHALDTLCRTPSGEPDAQLRDEVEALLRADALAQTSSDLLNVSEVASLVEGASATGERIGPWSVIRPIGRGGMGRVDLVERADGAYVQRAALKRLSLVAPSRLRRFLRERQILASLEHPGISRLLDGGVSDGGPYLVMEYVEGEPITVFAETHGLGLQKRLRLFLQVCDAVAYAHRHLVVHRDIKPSNVLVGTREAMGELEPRTAPGEPDDARVVLLDFGVARLLDFDAEDPITADSAAAPLTPGYAAPEQLRNQPVTTASDVWSLGVLLYELVARKRPFEGGTREAWIDAVLRSDPTAPSQAALTQDAPTTPMRRSEARRLRGDLDAICLTALRREPEARYASANDLAADVRRFLAREPVAARRPSSTYRIRRFVSRNRAAVAVTLLAVVVGLVASVAYTVSLRSARLSAERAAVEARREATTADRTAAFLTSLFEQSDPTGPDPGDRTATEILLAGEATLRTDLADEPAVLASLLATVGRVHRTLGRFDDAETALSDAGALFRQTGVNPLGHRDALLELANVQYRKEAYAGAERSARGALRLDSLHASGEESERLAILNTLGLVYSDTERLDEAAAMIAEIVAMRRAMPGEEAAVDLGSNLSNLGTIYLQMDRPAEALPLLDEAVEVLETHRGPRHPYVAYVLNSRSGVHEALGDLDRAVADQRRAVAIGEEALGEAHPFVAHARGMLADLTAAAAR